MNKLLKELNHNQIHREVMKQHMEKLNKEKNNLSIKTLVYCINHKIPLRDARGNVMAF